MPEYYWELDFSLDRRKYPVEWIGQTVTVNGGTLVYEADKHTGYSFADAYGCGDFLPVQSVEDAIGRLEVHRAHVAEMLADIDAVLEAARKATVFVDATEYEDDEDDTEPATEKTDLQHPRNDDES